VGPPELIFNGIGWAHPYYWFPLDWVGPELLIAFRLGGPAGINIQWDWLGPPVLLVSIGLAEPRNIDCNQIGWQNQYLMGSYYWVLLTFNVIGWAQSYYTGQI
jgi:hypothetical protein